MQLEGPINPVLAGIIGDPTLPLGTPSQIQLPPQQPGAGPVGPPNQSTQPPGPGAGVPQPQGAPGTASPPAQTLPQTGTNGPQLGVLQ